MKGVFTMNKDIQKIDRMLSSPVFRIALPIIIIAMYIIGVFMMIFKRFDQLANCVFYLSQTLIVDLKVSSKRIRDILLRYIYFFFFVILCIYIFCVYYAETFEFGRDLGTAV